MDSDCGQTNKSKSIDKAVSNLILIIKNDQERFC